MSRRLGLFKASTSIPSQNRAGFSLLEVIAISSFMMVILFFIFQSGNDQDRKNNNMILHLSWNRLLTGIILFTDHQTACSYSLFQTSYDGTSDSGELQLDYYSVQNLGTPSVQMVKGAPFLYSGAPFENIYISSLKLLKLPSIGSAFKQSLPPDPSYPSGMIKYRTAIQVVVKKYQFSVSNYQQATVPVEITTNAVSNKIIQCSGIPLGS
jgi:hypothetical protein